jgi:catechol 2,3-dioxygenase-like lactoylglutathione lyase family enzyme
MRMRLDHVQLAMPAGGEDAARLFFGDLLGMIEEEKPPVLKARGGCWFRRGDCAVHLGVDPDFRPARKAHPAFAVDDLHALATRLEAAGHPVKWDEALPGVDRFYADDPFGNRIEWIRG